MKCFIALATLVALVGAGASYGATAPLGNPFCEGISSPSELATLVEEALVHSRDGVAELDPARCHRTHPARPVDYLAMFQRDDPMANLRSVQDLPGYLRKLVSGRAPGGRFYMACLKPSRVSVTGWIAEHDCIAREFKTGEAAWYNPDTMRAVLASDCTNPVGLPEQAQNCIEIRFFTSEQATGVRLKEYGPRSIAEDACTMLKQAGSSDFESPWFEECPEVLCDFADIDAVPGMPKGWRKGSFKTSPGWNVLRLPAYVAERPTGDDFYVTVFCIERWSGPAPVPPRDDSQSTDPETVANYVRARERYIQERETWILTHSCGLGVQWFDYVDHGGTKTAMIYNDKPDATTAKATRADGKPSELWWHWQSSDGRCLPN